MALPPHVTIRYRPTEGGPRAGISIAGMAQYDQLMNQIRNGQRVHYISVNFENDFTTKSVRIHYNKEDKEYEIEYESHDEEKTEWVAQADVRRTIAKYMPQLS